MTNPPTDEEIHRLLVAAIKRDGALADGLLAIFTAGERRGIERYHRGMCEALAAIAQLDNGIDIRFRIVNLLTEKMESLRDAPAGEQNMSAGSSGSVDAAHRETAGETPSGESSSNSTQPGESGGQPTAKLEAAGEEPAVVCWLRDALAIQPKQSADASPCYTLTYGMTRDLIAWLDRPAPAAKEAGEPNAPR